MHVSGHHAFRWRDDDEQNCLAQAAPQVFVHVPAAVLQVPSVQASFAQQTCPLLPQASQRPVAGLTDNPAAQAGSKVFFGQAGSPALPQTSS